MLDLGDDRGQRLEPRFSIVVLPDSIFAHASCSIIELGQGLVNHLPQWAKTSQQKKKTFFLISSSKSCKNLHRSLENNQVFLVFGPVPCSLMASDRLDVRRRCNPPPSSLSRVSLLIRQEVGEGGTRNTEEGWQGIFHDIWWGKWVMLGVAALLASSSMAAIELITLYARLDNAVHKMAPPPPPSPPISLPASARRSPQKRLEHCSQRTWIRGLSSSFFLSLFMCS